MDNNDTLTLNSPSVRLAVANAIEKLNRNLPDIAQLRCAIVVRNREIEHIELDWDNIVVDAAVIPDYTCMFQEVRRAIQENQARQLYF